MSRAYKIQVSGSVEKVVHIDDGICTSLELLPILPAASMQAILAQQLTNQGFICEDNVARRESDDNTVIEINLKTGEVSVRVQADTMITETAEVLVTIVSDDDPEEVKKEQWEAPLQGQAEAKAVKQAEEKSAQMQKEAKRTLEKRLPKIREEIDQIINAVTREALKTRAGQMGQIEESVEDPETGSLMLKIRL